MQQMYFTKEYKKSIKHRNDRWKLEISENKRKHVCSNILDSTRMMQDDITSKLLFKSFSHYDFQVIDTFFESAI